MEFLRTAFALLLTGLALSAQSSDGPVIARYQLDGQDAAVSRDDLALELYRRFGRTEQGRSALEFLVTLTLIESAAQREGVMPDAAATRSWIEALSRRLQSAGMSLADLRRQKGMSQGAFAQYAALQLAQERLVRKALDLAADAPVQPSMLNLWLSEARAKAKVETAPDKLQPGTLARVGDRSLNQLDLGRVLVRTLDAEVRDRHVQQLVLRRQLEARAQAAGIEVTGAEMQREVASRKREAEANPAYQGVSFEELLQAQGTSSAELVRSPVLRAQVLERKLLDRELSPAALKERLAEDREAVLARFGARRRVSLILLNAADAAARATALARAQEIRQGIVDGLPFEDAARKHSEDPYSRVTGGDAGWQHRTGGTLPQPVLDRAFRASIHGLSQPIETERGYYIVRVTGIEPEPNDATLGFRLRQARSQELRQELITAAGLRFVEAGR